MTEREGGEVERDLRKREREGLKTAGESFQLYLPPTHTHTPPPPPPPPPSTSPTPTPRVFFDQSRHAVQKVGAISQRRVRELQARR